MPDDAIARVHAIGKKSYTRYDGSRAPLLSEQECALLTIKRGTLSDGERRIMEDHAVHTIKMLEQLPFPRHLERVPEFAGAHHERLDGTGYPRGLSAHEIALQTRIIALADVFEALTSSERPYKPAKTLSETFGIMSKMVEANHLDPDVFRVFIHSGAYLEYAKKFLKPEQLDDFDFDTLSALDYQIPDDIDTCCSHSERRI